MEGKRGSRHHLNTADNAHLRTLVDFENRRERIHQSRNNELVVEIPVALLDIFERETVIPLNRPRTHSNAAALRIRQRGLEDSSFVTDG